MQYTLPFLALFGIACAGPGPTDGIVVGEEGATGGVPGSIAAGGQPGILPSDGLSALSVDIHDADDLVIDLVTVACPGDCVEVEAVARGGFPPYRYAWSNGSPEPVQRLCPDGTTTFSVTATDSGSTSPEFRRAPETATAEVTANVLRCGSPPPDAGEPAVDPDPDPDPLPTDAGAAAPDGSTGLCFTEPSTAAPSCESIAWTACPDPTWYSVEVDHALSLGECVWVSGLPLSLGGAHLEFWGAKGSCVPQEDFGGTLLQGLVQHHFPVCLLPEGTEMTTLLIRWVAGSPTTDGLTFELCDSCNLPE